MKSMNRVEKIIHNYNRDLYGATMLGEEIGEKVASAGFEAFKKDIIAVAETGLTKEESANLLAETICMQAKAFLIALSVCNNFYAFSKLLNTLEPRMAVLENSDSAGLQRGFEFFSMVMSADTRGLPKLTDFKRYKEMCAAMLEKSNTPDADVMRTVVTEFESQFVTDDSEAQLQCPIM